MVYPNMCKTVDTCKPIIDQYTYNSMLLFTIYVMNCIELWMWIDKKVTSLDQRISLYVASLNICRYTISSLDLNQTLGKVVVSSPPLPHYLKSLNLIWHFETSLV